MSYKRRYSQRRRDGGGLVVRRGESGVRVRGGRLEAAARHHGERRAALGRRRRLRARQRHARHAARYFRHATLLADALY